MLTQRRPALALGLGAAFLAATLVLSGSASVAGQSARPGKAVAPRPTPAGAPADWKDIDRLVSEQKFEEAAGLTAKRREAAQRAGDEADWTKALIREVQLRTGLHGYETAVRFLKEQPWPQGLLSQTALELFYAQSLVNYFHVYSWEIQKREHVESAGSVDLKSWTGPQIYAEAGRAYLHLWSVRDALASYEVTALKEFLRPNDYPPNVRGTLRDAVAYLFAAHLADSSGWSPAQSNEVFLLDLSSMLRSGSVSRSVRLDDGAAHPLLRAVAVLDDEEAWHASRGEREAALEARLERLRRLFESFPEEEDRRSIESDLERRLKDLEDAPWWAMGKAQLAEFVARPDSSGDLVRARSIALEGARAYPGAIGGQRCNAIAERIAAPDYQIEAMSSDGPGRRSIRVLHKNIRRLLFRPYAVDLAARVARLEGQRDLFPAGDALTRIVDGQAPAAEWTASLPSTPDFKMHASYVVPPLRDPGFFVIAASGAAAFGGPGFPVTASTFLLSDLVLVIPQTAQRNPDGSGALEVEAVSGQTGRPLSGVTITAFRVNWNPEAIEKITAATTGESGAVLLRFPEERQWANRLIFARRGADLAIDRNGYYGVGPPPAGQISASLVFTDRSIYRPQQRLFWKVLAYRGDSDRGRFEAYPSAPVTVSLYDANNQKVEERLVTSNSFGSAAGEFSIPSGRALGAWSVRSSLGNASASVRVEEYKRPTFEVTWKDPAEPLRLNRKASLTGEARYYFGLPVSSGTARWSVARTPQWFWWSFWWGVSRPGAQRQIVASGTSPLEADGTFQVSFTPSADERLGKGSRDLTYNYAVEADVADEGGETRSASRAFRLGFVSVEARFEMPGGFLEASEPGRVKVVRTTLDGVARAGNGSWRLLRVAQPAVTLLPAEEPPDPPADSAAFRDARGRSAPALAGAVRAGARGAALERRRRGVERRADARREGRGVP